MPKSGLKKTFIEQRCLFDEASIRINMVDMERHARHLVLPQVGIEGQEKLG